MHTDSNVKKSKLGLLSGLENDWSVVGSRRKQKFLLVFGVKSSTSLIEFKIACGDTGVNWLVSRARITKIENYMKIIVSNKFAKLLTRGYVSKLSWLMRVSYGWSCVCDEMSVGDYNVNKICDSRECLVFTWQEVQSRKWLFSHLYLYMELLYSSFRHLGRTFVATSGVLSVSHVFANINLVNRYDILQHGSSNVYDKALASVSPAGDVVQGNNKVLSIKQRSLRIGTWNLRFTQR